MTPERPERSAVRGALAQSIGGAASYRATRMPARAARAAGRAARTAAGTEPAHSGRGTPPYLRPRRGRAGDPTPGALRAETQAAAARPSPWAPACTACPPAHRAAGRTRRLGPGFPVVGVIPVAADGDPSPAAPSARLWPFRLHDRARRRWLRGSPDGVSLSRLNAGMRSNPAGPRSGAVPRRGYRRRSDASFGTRRRWRSAGVPDGRGG